MINILSSKKSKTWYAAVAITTVAMLGFLFASALPALATQDPLNCTGNGVGLELAVYRADQTTVIIGGSTVESGETIYYRATLSQIGSSCNFEGGSLSIETPDGVSHEVTNPVPLVSSGSPHVSSFQSYVVSEGDVLGGNITATADYVGGESHTGQQHDDAQATVNRNTPYTDVALEVTKDALPTAEETYRWLIDKSVLPSTWDLFVGDSGTSEYTIDLTKELVGTTYAVSGTISIHNPAQFATAHVTDVSDVISGLGAVAVVCPGGLSFDIAPGDTVDCTYSTDLPDGTARTNTATVTTDGDVDGGEGNADFDPGSANPNVVNGEVNVDDTFDEGDGGPFSSSTSYTYTRQFVCGDGQGEYQGLDNEVGNTATIVETEDFDSALVTVSCYDLSVEKDATPSFDRTITWDIVKTVDVHEHNLLDGETGDSNYTVTLSKDVVDSNYAVSGSIIITNNHPTQAADLTDVVDELTGAIGALVVCPSNVVPAAGQLVCTYSTDLPDSADRTNTATVTQQNYDYDETGAATLDGTTDYSGNANVDFTGVNPNLIGFNQVTVDDDNTPGQNSWGPFDSDGDFFQYTLQFTCREDEGDHPNIATIVETQQSDDELVTVTCAAPSTAASADVDLDVIVAGDQVVLTITETNNGDVDLTDAYVDLQPLGATLDETSGGFSSNINGDSTLEVGETWTWTVNDSPASDTTYVAIGHGTDPFGNDVTWCEDVEQPGENVLCDQEERAEVSVDVTDPSIDIEKHTNGEDADSPTGPLVPVGDPVLWEYFVTNTGDVTLTNVVVTDDQGVVVTCPKDTLAAAEEMTCTGNGVAEAGQYENLADVVGTPPVGPDVTDEDPSHYFGSDPSIDIEKHTNGEDADSPTGPLLGVGDPVLWEYFVTNTGNVTLTNVTVTDDQGVVVTCPKDTLAPGEQMTCTGNGVAGSGQYANLGDVVGTPPVGDDVTDEDPSHYFGEIIGCTLTQGYWKTHSEEGPAAHPDDAWKLLPGGLAQDTIFFLSGQTWLAVFNTSVNGNAYYSLAHQYMAARLNVLAGASAPTEVSDAISAAEVLFNTHTPEAFEALGKKHSDRKLAVELAGTLGSYNEGLIGPGHCDDDLDGQLPDIN